MFHAILRGLRKEKGITQQTLADEMNLSVDTVRRWESGKSKPNYEEILNLSEKLDVSTDVLFGGEESKNEQISKELSNTLKLLHSYQLSSLDIIIIVAMLAKMAIEQTHALSAGDYDILRILLDRTNEALQEKRAQPANTGQQSI